MDKRSFTEIKNYPHLQNYFRKLGTRQNFFTKEDKNNMNTHITNYLSITILIHTVFSFNNSNIYSIINLIYIFFLSYLHIGKLIGFSQQL